MPNRVKHYGNHKRRGHRPTEQRPQIGMREDIEKYVNKEQLNKLVEKNNNIYYYVLVKKGWFSLTKEVYLVNMYNKTVYKCVDDKISKI